MTVDLGIELRSAIYSYRTCVFIGGKHKKILVEYLHELFGKSSTLIDWDAMKKAKAVVGVKRKAKRGKELPTGRDWFVVDVMLDDKE